MSSTVIRIENLSKQYRLGEIGTGSIAHDVNRWWHRIRGKEDPYSTVGHAKDRPRTEERKAELEKLNPDYVWVLKDINFEVQQGEILGIIGHNGAGKSTLLKILSRVTAPTGGAVKVKGRIASLLEVGTGFHPDLTGRENIFLNGAILGMTKAEITRKFDEIVDFSGCEQFMNTPVKRYSSGMYVRLAFAVAAHLEPEILIVDEVLAVGDAEFQKKCLGKMRDVAGHGRAVLFVSHNMTAITAFCHRTILLSKGRIIMDGSASEVTEAYQLQSMENSCDSRFLDTAHRDGTGAARFLSLTLKAIDRAGKHVSFLYQGCDLVIDIEIESANESITGANVAIIIYDGTGSRLIDVNTGLRDEYLDLAAHQCVSIRFILNDVLLAAGTYYIGLWLGRQGVEVFDHLESAKSFRVVDDPLQTKHAYNFPGRYRCRFETLTSKLVSRTICE